MFVSGRASDDKGSATARSLDRLGIKSLGPAVVTRRKNHAPTWYQFELEGVEPEGQSLAYGFERRFLEAPELGEGLEAGQTVGHALNGRSFRI